MDTTKNLLAPDGNNVTNYMDAMIRAVNIFDSFLGKSAQTDEAKEYGCFQYVSYNEKKFFSQISKVMQILSMLNKRNKARFIDVGCGIGTKVFLASTLFSEAHGIEIDDNYITTGLNIIKHCSPEYTSNLSLKKRDALQFSHYRDYDVIYIYRPFHNVEKQNELEEKITRGAQENTVIVGMLCNFHNLPEQIRPKMIFNNGYIKSSNEQFVEKIRKELKSEGGNYRTCKSQ